jgi:uncharacterized protein (DUF4415 family)
MRLKSTPRNSRTNWDRIAKMRDKDINLSDIPAITEEQFKKAVFKPARIKKTMAIEIDRDIIEWYKKEGQNYQTQINEDLRKQIQERKKKSLKTKLRQRSFSRLKVPQGAKSKSKKGV